MNKQDFDNLILEKEEAFEEAMNDWQGEYLLEKVIKAKSDLRDYVTIHQQDIPDCGKGIEAVAEYLKKNGFDVVTFFSNDMSGKGKHFELGVG